MQLSAARTVPPHRPGPPPPAARPISYWQLARAHKFPILGFFVLGAIAGTANVTLKTPLYDASTTVELVGFNQSFMGMNQVDPQAGTDATSASASNMQTQISILKSRTLLNRVTDRMNLELAPQVSAPATPFTTLRNHIPFLQQDPLVQSREALTEAARTLGVRQVGLTRLLEISCSSTSPDVAANFLNALASEQVQQIQAARSNVTQQTSQWMDSQLEEARSRLQQSGEKLRDFVQKSGMDFFPDQATLADTKMGSLRTDVSAIQADRIAKQTRWELVQKTPPASLPDVLNDPTLQGLKGQITTLRGNLAPLTATLTAENPRVRKVQDQINEMEKALTNEEASLIKRVQSDYEEALRREKLLTGAYNAQTHSVSAQADKSSQYAMLKRDVDTDQQLYNNLLQQSSQAALVALAPTSSIRVVDAAIPNSQPSSPNPAKDIPTWAFAAGVLGYALLLLREMARRKKLEKLFDSPGYTQTFLGVPELGVIPSTQIAQPARKLLTVAQWRPWQSAGNGKEPDTATENGHSTPSVGGNGYQSTLLSESFRQTLVSLLRTKPRGHNPVYVITSAGPGEGKTTLSANLARAMAEIGQRVLLVDADLRRPHVHTLLELGDHRGLSDVLAGPVEIGDLALDDFIQPTRIDNLSVMTHGLTESETPLFFSDRVAGLVALLRTRFDCILFDTAPALPFPDARLWGRHSDGVVLVVRAGVTTREGASVACERLLADGIPVLGTILNDWNPMAGSALPYYYKSYQSAGPKQ
jgi:capsular exopolysaccharide synthesis family protein